MRAQREWSHRIAKTWLGRRGAVQQLDAFVLGRAKFHRNEEVAARKDNKDDHLARIQVETPLAVRLDVVVNDVLVHGRRGRWYAATCAICLTTELLFGADGAATTFGDAIDRLEPGLAFKLKPLRLVRNAVMHPSAWRSEGVQPPFIEQLVRWMDGQGEGAFATQLRTNWANIGHPLLAGRALAWLNDAGVTYAEKCLRISCE